MAISVIEEVRRTEIGSPTDKAVLACLASYASKDGSGIFPSILTMMADTELGRTTVFSGLGRLEERKVIYRTGKKPCGVVIYNIDLDALRKLPQRKLGVDKRLPNEEAQIGTDVPSLQQSGETEEVPEPDPSESGSGTQTVKEPKNTITKAKEPVFAKNSDAPVLTAELESAVDAYNAVAEERGWARFWGGPRNYKIPLLKVCIRQAGGIDGWKAEMQKAGKSDFLCGRGGKFPFKNNLPYLLNNFDKLLEGGFDNHGTITPSKPLSSYQINASTMSKILRHVAQEFGVEDWKLKSKKFALDFPQAVRRAVTLMEQQGIPADHINDFMSLETAA